MEERERGEARGGEKRTRRSFILSGSDGDIDRCNATSQTVSLLVQRLTIARFSPLLSFAVSLRPRRTTQQTISTSVITEHLGNPLLYISFSLKGSLPVDSLETPCEILLSERSSFYSRVLEDVICSNTSLCFGSPDLCENVAPHRRRAIRLFAK